MELGERTRYSTVPRGSARIILMVRFSRGRGGFEEAGSSISMLYALASTQTSI